MTNQLLTDELTLQKLVEADESAFAPCGIPGVFGDRYLCAENPLFRTVRQTCLSMGYVFDAGQTTLSTRYKALPLLTLQEVIDSGVVPVYENADVVRPLMAAKPNSPEAVRFLVNTLQKNYLLHESAHCIAFRALTGIVGESGMANKLCYVVVCLLCEAYANAIERLAAAMAASETHKTFIALNSYVEPAGLRLLSTALNFIPAEDLLLFSISIFFRVNRCVQCEEADIARVIQMLVPGSQAESGVLQMLGLTLPHTLSKKFVNETTPIFFAAQQCEREYEEVRQEYSGGQVPRWVTAIDLGRCLESLVAITYTPVAVAA
jgi:hypothetical protein